MGHDLIYLKQLYENLPEIYSITKDRFPRKKKTTFEDFYSFWLETHPNNLDPKFKLSDLEKYEKEEQSSTSQIDICTVNYNTDDLILENFSRFNATLYVGENTPYKYSNCVKVPGTPQSECLTPKNNFGKQVGQFNGGINHAKTLERCIETSTSRYILLADPDFFSTMPLQYYIDYMQRYNLAVLGAPNGIKSRHRQKHLAELPLINLLPGSFFTIIDREKYKEKILLNYFNDSKYYDKRENNNEPYSYYLIDVAHPFRQTLHKYKWESFKVCVGLNCSLCKSIFKKEPPQFIERFFLEDNYIAAHLHSRKQYDSYRPQHIKINHGNNFV